MRILQKLLVIYFWGFPGGASDIKNTLANAGEVRVRSLVQEDPLEEDMVTHSSILAERIPWTDPLGHSVGSKRYPLGLESRAEFFASPIYQA